MKKLLFPILLVLVITIQRKIQVHIQKNQQPLHTNQKMVL